MEDKELYNPQNGEVIKAKRPKQFWKDWRFYVYTLIAIMLAIVSFSSCLTACAAINAGVGLKEDASYSVAQRKNAVITTDGGYTGYSFELSSHWEATEYAGCVYTYTVDLSTYSLNDSSNTDYIFSSYTDFCQTMGELYDTLRPSALNQIDFMAAYAYIPFGGADRYFFYYSFLPSSSGLTTVLPRSFVITTSVPNLGVLNIDALWAGLTNGGSISSFQYVLNQEQCTTVFVDRSSTAIPFSSITFQDVVSYYKELGYQEGYDVGSSAGYETGHSAGYNEGYASGNANGYASGYEQATQDYQTGIAFTSYGLYANAQLTLTTDEVIGNYSYMYLFKYVTSNYDEHTVYVLFTQNSSTSQYLGYVLDRNDSDDSTSAVTIGSFLAQSSLAVTITAEQDQYFELYTGFVTSFYDRGSEVIEAVWFSGGTSQTALQNYQDGYDTGYEDGVSAGYGSGYEAGYAVGEVDGANSVDPEALTTTLVTLFQQPFNQIYRFFNFNILGLNILGLVTGLFTVFIIWKIYKKVF